MKIAVVVPTIRQESLTQFLRAWEPIFNRHGIVPIIVRDGSAPTVEMGGTVYTVEQIMGKNRSLIYNFNDGVRNLGFVYALMKTDADYIVTLDDDVEPYNDSDALMDHVQALSMRVPVTWMSTSNQYPRGFPYKVRQEAAVWASHGVWHGVHDYDAPTQLVRGNPPMEFLRCPIPKGVFAPICGMNFAFRREATPYVYYAPMGDRVGYNRFADIWMGVELKRSLDALGHAIVTGYSAVLHKKASNVYKNLQLEAAGIELNETFYERCFDNPYVRLHQDQLQIWREMTQKLL